MVDKQFTIIEAIHGITFANFNDNEIRELSCLANRSKDENSVMRTSHLGKYLYKYCSLENTLHCFTSSPQYLYFLNPSCWNDPSEKYFLDCTYRKKPFPLKDKVLCNCMTLNKENESQWRQYSDNTSTRLQINLKTLLIELSLLKNDYVIYVGKVMYCKQTDIFATDISDVFSNCYNITGIQPNDITSNTLRAEKLQVLLMLLKRIPYSYEKEIRIVLIPKGKLKSYSNKVPLSLKNICNLITLSPESNSQTRDMLNNIFKTTLPRFELSHLYSEKKPRNFK